MPPSVLLVASAWESWGPGLLGSLNGKVVAVVTGAPDVELVGPAAGVAADDAALPREAAAGARLVVGAALVVVVAPAEAGVACDELAPWVRPVTDARSLTIIADG